MRSLVRWVKFNGVGIAGAVVQLCFLRLFLNAHANYLAATALAVEAAVLHNFAWHQRYTWADRPCEDLQGVLGRLGRFQLSNGVVSILANLMLMRLLAGSIRLSPLAANFFAILICSVINYHLGDRFVFPSHEKSAIPAEEPRFETPQSA